jgi:hypothetical protein
LVIYRSLCARFESSVSESKGPRRAWRLASGEQSRAALASLHEQLLAWRDPIDNRQVVEAVYEEKPTAQNRAVAPDLIVGYSRGYRGSWQTGIGATRSAEIEDNNDAWIGDH